MASLFQHDVAMLFWCNSEIYYVLCQLGYTTQHQKGYLIEHVKTIVNIDK